MKKRFLFLTMVFSMLNVLVTQAQDDQFFRRTRVLVMFKQGVITLPDGVNQAPPSEVANLPSWLSGLATSNGLEYIAKSNPAFVPGDTIKIRSDGRKIKTLDFSRIFYLIFPDGLNMDSISQYVKNQNEVIFVDRWPIIEPLTIPNDQYFNQQWALRNTLDTLHDINADGAWDYFPGDGSVKIGIFDTGVKYNHDDFGSKVSGDLIAGEHGTKVAGIAAAIGNNGIGVAGVDWNAQIFNKRIVYSGCDARCVYEGVMEAIAAGCSVLNNSWRVLENFDSLTLIRCAFAYAYKNNVVSVAGMANDGDSAKNFPAADEQSVIAVGATDHNDVVPDYSNIGSWIDVVAPGGPDDPTDVTHQIYTTDWLSNSAYGYIRRTSASTPHVSGLASLLKGYKPSLYNDDIENIIELSAKDLDIAGWDKNSGWGRIDAKAAFDLLQLPNRLETFTASGGTAQSYVDLGNQKFYGVVGLEDGQNYSVLRHKVVKYVTFDGSYYSTPHVWGVGYTTVGFSPANPNFGLGFCETVPGSVTTTGCSLRTYVYEVTDFNPTVHFPTYSLNVTFGYSVLGERTLETPVLTATSSAGPPNAIYLRWQECNVNEESVFVKRKTPWVANFDTIGRIGPMNECIGVQGDGELPDFVDTAVLGSEVYIYQVGNWTRHQTAPSPIKILAAKPREPKNLTAKVLTYPCGEMMGSMESMESIELVEAEAAGPACPINLVELSWQAPPDSIQKPGTISQYKIRALSTDSLHEKWITAPATQLKDTICLFGDRDYDFWAHVVDTYGALGTKSNKVTKTTGAELVICTDEPLPTRAEIPGDNPNDKTQTKPTEFSLSQNYPNPFNLSTQIRYSLPKDANVQIVIYNILGQKIKVFDLGYQTTGYRSVVWDGTNQNGEVVSSGLYLYRIKAGEFAETKRMTLLK